MNLKPEPVHDWSTLSPCLTSSVEAKFKLTEITRKCQYPGEDLNVYVKRFYEKALDCYDLICRRHSGGCSLCSIVKGYQVYVENLTFS